MKLRNKYLIEQLNQEISIHNAIEQEQIPLIDLKNPEIREEELLKFNSLYIEIDDNVPLESIDDYLTELSKILKVVNIEQCGIDLKYDKPIKLNTDFIQSINKNVKFLTISGVNLSNFESKEFNQFENLEVLELDRANIKDVNFIKNIDKRIKIDLGKNPISQVISKELITEIESRNSNGQLRIALNDCPIYIPIVMATLSKNVKLYNCDINKENIGQYVKIFNKYNCQVNVTIEQLELLEQISDRVTFPIGVIAMTSKEITNDFLKQRPNIQQIQIKYSEEEKAGYAKEPYTREEFEKIREEINRIKSEIVIPDEFDENREKKIFMQVYRLLGNKISYNFFAIAEENEDDEELQKVCRNLYGGLVDNETVCAGYAIILKAILEEFDIECKYIPRDADKNHEDYTEEMDDKGHSWNLVKLDGKEYYCDLTWDADDIKMERYPLKYCLTDSETFGHEIYNCPIIENSLCYAKQLRLMGFDEQEIYDIFCNMMNEEYDEYINEDENEEYTKEELEYNKEYLERLLSSFVSSTSSDIKNSDFYEIDRAFEEKENNLEYDK